MEICGAPEKPESPVRPALVTSTASINEVLSKWGGLQQEQLQRNHEATLQMLTEFSELHQKQLQEQRAVLDSLDRKFEEQSQSRLRQAGAITVPMPPSSCPPRLDSKTACTPGSQHASQVDGKDHAEAEPGPTKEDKQADAALRQQYFNSVGWQKKMTKSKSSLMELKPKLSTNMSGMPAPTDKCQSFFKRLVHNNVFMFVSSMLVLANSVMIGVQVDMDLRRAQKLEGPLPWESHVDLGFTAVFLVELLLRLCADRLYFFIGPAWRWNMFDTLVVSLGVVDLFEVLTVNFTALRVLRVVRVVRILRIIRVFKIFRELRMMALSILSCLNSLIWAFSLLLIVMYIYTLVLLQGARDYLRNSDSVDPTIKQQLATMYTGVVYTLYMLLQAISGGNSWGDIAVPFLNIHSAYGVSFTIFIIFLMFGLLNVLVGVFVQNTEAIATIDRDFVLQEEMNRKTSNINRLRELFGQVDIDGSGTISWKELKSNLGDESMKAYFAMMQIEIEEAEGLFNLLDIDESGEVAIEEFIMGCMRLKGAAKSIDLASLLYENKRLHVMIHRHMSHLYQEINGIRTQINPYAIGMAAISGGVDPNPNVF